MFARFRRRLATWNVSRNSNRTISIARRTRRLAIERLEPRQVLATLVPIPAVPTSNIVLPTQDQLTRDQHNAQLATSPAGDSYVVVWQHETNAAGTATEVHFQGFSLNGTPLFAEQKLAASALRSDDQDARISIADNGTFIITWEATVGAGGQQNVFFQKFSANGTPLTAIQAVSTAAGTNSNPDILHYPSGLEAIVVWQHSSSPAASNSSIRYMRFDFDSPTGSEVTPNSEKHVSERREADGVVRNQSPRIVDMSGTEVGSAMVAWVGFDLQTHSDIYLRFYDSFDADELDGMAIGEFSGYPRIEESRSAPSLSTATGLNVNVIFSETVTIPGQPLDHDLYMARLNSSAFPVSPNHVTGIDVDGHSGFGSARRDVLRSSISTTTAGVSAVAWQVERSLQGIPTNDSTHLEAQLFDINGVPASQIVSVVDQSNVQISGPGKQLGPQVIAMPDGQHAIVGWASEVNRRTNNPADNLPRQRGDQDLVVQVFSIAPGGVIPPPPQLPPNSSPGAIESRVIAATYQLALGRFSDSPGLNYWTGKTEEMSRVQVARQLFESSEFRTRAINDAYQQLLNRAADDPGRRYWLSQLESGQSLQHLLAGILGSEEYRELAGGSNADFVRALYQDVLGRAPDIQGEFFWNAQITGRVDRATGAATNMDRAGVAMAILTSEEATLGQVSDLYTNLLQRAADPVGLMYWSGRLRAGAHFEEVISAFLGSAEYFTQFQLYVTQNALTGSANSDSRNFLLGTGRSNWNWLRSLL